MSEGERCVSVCVCAVVEKVNYCKKLPINFALLEMRAVPHTAVNTCVSTHKSGTGIAADMQMKRYVQRIHTHTITRTHVHTLREGG